MGPRLIHERRGEGIWVIWVCILFKEYFGACLLGQGEQAIAWSAMRSIQNPNHHGTKSEGTLGRAILGGSRVKIANVGVNGSKAQIFEVPIEDGWISDRNMFKCERK